MTDEETPADELRAWARGSNPLSAATELLIRGGFAQSWRPWVHTGGSHGYWVAFDEIPDETGGMSGGQRRFLRIAASLGGDSTAVVLGDEVPGLDREHTELILAAIAHANGMHQPGTTLDITGSGSRVRQVPALHSWPELAAPAGTGA